MLVRAQHRRVKLAIGWHPNYQRAFDLDVQIRLENLDPEYLLYASPGWDELCMFVKKTWG
jgi:hypothetical protein